MKLDWKEPRREWEECFYLGYLPDTWSIHSLYSIYEGHLLVYSAQLDAAPYTDLGTTYSLEKAKALCEQHAEEHIEDYVLPLKAEFERARARYLAGNTLLRPACGDDSLLRPASSPGTDSPDELLRPAEAPVDQE